MTPSQHVPLMPWATHMIQSPVQRDAIPQGGANPYKAGASSDWGLQLDPMKPESLVIAGQLYCGEYVLESCTHCPSNQGSREHLKIDVCRSKVSLVTRVKSSNRNGYCDLAPQGVRKNQLISVKPSSFVFDILKA